MGLSVRPFASLFLALSLLCSVGEAAARPRIGLVLGGGGARGAAHIGVLEVLQEMRVPVDCVAGTSMGALVAGTWVAGMSPAAMREALGAVDWSDMFIDNPEYAELSPRNKQLARLYLPGSESGVKADGVKYQPGIVSGQKIKLFFNQLVQATRGERNLQDLALPLSIVATDIGTGERVVFRDGSLSQAMRASMSVPGLLAPVDFQGRKLVDGGLVDNLPVAEVRDRCQADVVIAVNVGTPLLKAEDVGSLLTVSSQMIAILTEQNVSRSLAMLGPEDVVIRPELDGIRAGDFARHEAAAERGRVAAQAVRDRLAHLAVDDATYTAWRASLQVEPKDASRIDEVQVVGLDRVHPDALARHLHVQPGDSLRPGQLDADLLRMFGDGWYEGIDYSVLSTRERNILRVSPVEKRWGPDYLRFGINLQADNSQGTSFGLRAAYHSTWLNRLGGELLVTTDIGSTNRLGVDLYQPLDPGQRFFVEGMAGVEDRRIGLYQDDRRVAQYRTRENTLAVYLGANVGVLGPVRLGWLQRQLDYNIDIGIPNWPEGRERVGGWQVALDFDQFDRMYFPTRGWAAQVAYFNSSDGAYARVESNLQAAFHVGGTVFNARLRHVGSPHGSLPLLDAGRLGGFLNMTAYAPNQIIGDDIVYGGLRSERIIGQLPLGLRGDMRLGFALEAARVGTRYTESARDGVLDSAALYLGGQTPLGPAYLGLGRSSSGATNIFLFIGTP